MSSLSGEMAKYMGATINYPGFSESVFLRIHCLVIIRIRSASVAGEQYQLNEVGDRIDLDFFEDFLR